MTSGFGAGPNLKGGSAPGFVDPFSQGVLNQNTAISEQAMHNRYAQLGLGVPAGPPQGSNQALNRTYGGPGTAEQMDLGMLPSMVGGIPGMAQATLGQMQTNALSNPSGGGSKAGGASSLGPLGALLGGGGV